MLAHFGVPAVWISYTAAVISTIFFVHLLTPLWGAVTAGVVSLLLIVVDYRVHNMVHKGQEDTAPTAPIESVIYALVVVMLFGVGAIVVWWQLAGLYLAQAVWDNSWHARRNHRKDDEPQGDLDHWLIRWGAAAIACFMAVAPWISEHS